LVANKAHHPKQTEQFPARQGSKRTESVTSLELLQSFLLFVDFLRDKNFRPNSIGIPERRNLQSADTLPFFTFLASFLFYPCAETAPKLNRNAAPMQSDLSFYYSSFFF
jgi:hypothetical protein